MTTTMDNLDATRINERIRIRQVLLIDEKGEQQGVVETREAFRRAQELGLDLVEVAPNNRPPVCKIMDFGKYKYDKKKKQKHVKASKLHEIRISPSIDIGDLTVKINKIKEFIADGDKVQVNLKFSGREIVHKDLGRQKMQQIIDSLGPIAKVERSPFVEGKHMTMILNSA